MRNTNFIGSRRFGEAQSKTMRAYAQSGQYHTILESRLRLTITITHFHFQQKVQLYTIIKSAISLNVAKDLKLFGIP